MFDAWKQWLIQNSQWVEPATGIVGLTLLLLIQFFFNPIGWAIPKLWSFLHRPSQTGENQSPANLRSKQSPANLRFVAMDFPRSHWVMGSQGDKPILVITTRWHVTHMPNPSAKPWSAIPVRPLKVHLLKPFAKDLIRAQVVTMSDECANTRLETVIPEGQMREFIIDCHLSTILKHEDPLKVHLAVEDQFANKHKLPPVTVFPIPTGK